MVQGEDQIPGHSWTLSELAGGRFLLLSAVPFSKNLSTFTQYSIYRYPLCDPRILSHYFCVGALLIWFHMTLSKATGFLYSSVVCVRGTSLFTMVFTTGCRGISAAVSGAPLPSLLHWPGCLQGYFSHIFSLFSPAAIAFTQ